MELPCWFFEFAMWVFNPAAVTEVASAIYLFFTFITGLSVFGGGHRYKRSTLSHNDFYVMYNHHSV